MEEEKDEAPEAKEEEDEAAIQIDDPLCHQIFIFWTSLDLFSNLTHLKSLRCRVLGFGGDNYVVFRIFILQLSSFILSFQPFKTSSLHISI